jgi:hypothetical protein
MQFSDNNKPCRKPKPPEKHVLWVRGKSEKVELAAADHFCYPKPDSTEGCTLRKTT